MIVLSSIGLSMSSKSNKVKIFLNSVRMRLTHGGGDGVEYLCNHMLITKIKMKKNVKFLVGGLVGVVVVVAAYFGASENLFQGRLTVRDKIVKNSVDRAITKGEFVKLFVNSMKVDVSSLPTDCLFSDSSNSKGVPTSPSIPGMSSSPVVSDASLFTTVSKSDEIAPYLCFLYKNNMWAETTSVPFDANANIRRINAANFFSWGYSSAIDLNKAVKPYPMISACGANGKCMYSDVDNTTINWSAVSNLGALGVWEVKPWQNANFFPNENLTLFRAQLWADNFSKLIK